MNFTIIAITTIQAVNFTSKEDILFVFIAILKVASFLVAFSWSFNKVVLIFQIYKQLWFKK